MVEITDEELDDLVDEWHENSGPTYSVSLEQYITSNTDWTREEYFHWLVTGEQP